jgi:hypothetical protein
LTEAQTKEDKEKREVAKIGVLSGCRSTYHLLDQKLQSKVDKPNNGASNTQCA